MFWIFALLLQLTIIGAGIRDEERAGRWSWPRFLIMLAFAGLECAILILPPYYIHDVHNRYFWPVYFTCWLVGLANMVWMIRTVRRWKPTSSDPGN